MKRCLWLILALLMVVPATHPQKKSHGKSQPIKIDLQAGIVEGPDDEILFYERDIVRASQTEGWRFVDGTRTTTEGHHTLAYYDRSRITRQRGKAVAWLKYSDQMGNVEQFYVMILAEYDCSNQRSRILEAIRYDKSDVTDARSPKHNPWERVIPGSLDDQTYKIICKGGMDTHEYLMRMASADFKHARQLEKEGSYESARGWYQFSLSAAPRNPKILAALERIETQLKGSR